MFYRGWEFIVGEENPIFGKMKIVAIREEIEEVFYVYSEALTVELCEDLYNEYLYSYGEY